MPPTATPTPVRPLPPLPPIPEGDRPLLVIVGPTASGKTALSLHWAERLQTEIIGADSVQVHVGLDIGSAKPTPAELARIPHHGISVLSPRERPSAGRWLGLVTPAIERLHAAGRVPIVCGGTGLYVRALLEGLADIPDVAPEVRAELLSRLERLGPEALHAELAAVDPDAARRISPRDPQRVTRALEVYLATGTPITTWQRETTRRPDYRPHVVALDVDREVLGRRIAVRATAMVRLGLVDEVRALLALHPPDCPGLSTLGYREVVAAISSGDLAPERLSARLTLAHRQYAKRQQTWFRRAHADTRLTTD